MTSSKVTHSRTLQIRRQIHRPLPLPLLIPTPATFRDRGGSVAAELQMHPLNGLRSAYYLCMSERIEDIASPWRRFFIRLVYFKWQWYSGGATHDMGIFTDREVAESIAKQKRDETGKAWSVKELPVNGLLPDKAVRYGFYSFPGSNADKKYRNRRVRLQAVESGDVQQLKSLMPQVERLIETARAG